MQLNENENENETDAFELQLLFLVERCLLLCCIFFWVFN